jgi:serine phosphatase RsbU (regulator of sigma subunit)/Tfp pilus assembly protein PilF
MDNLLKNLISETDTLSDEHARIDRVNETCWKNRDDIEKYDEHYHLLLKNLEDADKLNYKNGQAFAIVALSFYMWVKADYDNALVYTARGIELCKEIDNWEGSGFANVMAGYCYMGKGDYGKAYELLLEALKIVQDKPHSEGRGWAVYSHGIFHFDTKNYDESIRYYAEALENFEKMNLDFGIARARSGIGSALLAQGKLEEAHEIISGALEAFRRTGNRPGMSRTLNDMGVIMRKLMNYEKAEEYLLDSLRIREGMNHLEGLTTTAIDLGTLYLEAEKLEKALETFQRAQSLAERTKNKPKAAQIHHLLGDAYRALKDPWKALEHYEKYHTLKTEVSGETATNSINQLKTSFATEKSEKEAEIHRLKNVELKNAFDEINLQKKIIEDKNRDITDSIVYAKRIQEAILPTEARLKCAFPQSFALYKPKDIVSGDFFWTKQLNKDQFLLATADCTGHGVPGAFMSLLGTSFLNEITTQNITQPDRVMNKLREDIIKALNPYGHEERKDGMDMVLCSYDLKSMELKFSAANNPLWLIRNGIMQEHKPDKFPVGKYDNEQPFTLNTLKLQKGDVIYTFTDGYADQFGGAKNKKFTYKKFKEMILSIHTESMEKQKKLLDDTLEEWRGVFEQIDDILVIGIRI